MVIFMAFAYGWKGRDDEEPGVDIPALAMRAFFDDPGVTEDEKDKLAFRWALDAEEWLNRNVAPEGYLFGWHDFVFYLNPTQWWEPIGGPDQLWLP
jgi:hypothetical protein